MNFKVLKTEKNKMDLLQESSSIWDEFLRRPCPQADLLSIWPLAPFFPWHPWHLLNLGTLGIFCHMTPLPPLVPWHLWYSASEHETVTYCTVLWFPYFDMVPGNFKIKNWNEFLRMTTVLYCTVTSLADTHLLIKLFVHGPLDKKFSGWVVVGGWHCNYSFKLQGSRGDLESLSLVEFDSRPRPWAWQ